MDWIQYYTIILLVNSFISHYVMDGELVRVDFKKYTLSLIVAMPWIGRVLEFW